MRSELGLMMVSGAVAFGVLGCASQDVKLGPAFVVTTPVVQLSPGGKLAMYGTGFSPKQEVILLLKDSAGGMSSIGSALSPAAVANQDGAWAGEWDYSAYVKIVQPGTATITAADKDFKSLGQAAVVFVAPKPPAKPPAKPAAKGG